MRRRRVARLIILDSTGRALLFRFAQKSGIQPGSEYWGTPGGGLEEGETFEQAAIRELFEETGFSIEKVNVEVGRREAVFLLPNGENVISEERYFLIEAPQYNISTSNWTAEEREVTLGYQWWTLADIQNSSEPFKPDDLVSIWTHALDHRSQ